nr:MAG TPA: putative cellulose synthase A [Caudoviricetes sp.]
MHISKKLGMARVSGWKDAKKWLPVCKNGKKHAPRP